MTGSHKDIVTNSESDTRVLVAIPTLFTRDTLRNEIEGLERQTIPPDKILLITPKGDIGKDWEEFLAGRKKVELVYLDNYTREEVLSKIKDSRIDARNYALHRATHEFKDDDIIVFLDDDCPLDANWIEVAISNLKADGVGGFMGKTIHYRDHGKLRSLEETGLNIIKYLFGTNRV